MYKIKALRMLVIIILSLIFSEIASSWVRIYLKDYRKVVNPRGIIEEECYSKGRKCLVIVFAKIEIPDTIRVDESQFIPVGKSGNALRAILKDGDIEIIIPKDDDAELKIE